MDKKFIISPSPHIHSGNSVEGCMYGVLIALIPAFLVALYFFGLGALIVTVTSVLACVLFEYLIQKYILKGKVTISNGSAILTGVLLAFNVPSNLPVWIIIIGALVRYRDRENVVRRIGKQYFQSGISREGISIDFFSRTNDNMAKTGSIQLTLSGCDNRCDTS